MQEVVKKVVIEFSRPITDEEQSRLKPEIHELVSDLCESDGLATPLFAKWGFVEGGSR